MIAYRLPYPQVLEDARMPPPRAKIERTAFGDRMARARAHAGMSQKEAALAIGIKQPTISELEGTATKSAHTAKAAAVYGVRPTWLQTGEGPMLETDPGAISPRAMYVAKLIDEIGDQDAMDKACVLCEAFAAMAKAGQLNAVIQAMQLAQPAVAPSAQPRPGHSRQSASNRKART